jgi:hypothetical protein
MASFVLEATSSDLDVRCLDIVPLELIFSSECSRMHQTNRRLFFDDWTLSLNSRRKEVIGGVRICFQGIGDDELLDLTVLNRCFLHPGRLRTTLPSIG